MNSIKCFHLHIVLQIDCGYVCHIRCMHHVTAVCSAENGTALSPQKSKSKEMGMIY